MNRDDRVMISPRIDRNTKKRALIHCVEKGIPLQDFVGQAIEEKLEKDEKHDSMET